MSAADGLERRYRRQLAWYPAAHRRAHEEEMLGVLMMGARAGQRRPGLMESADLIWGALRIRLRPARDGSARPAWRDAWAVVSVILPVLFVVYFAAGAFAILRGLPPVSVRPEAEYLAEGLAGRVILAALVLLRLRRTAALAAAAAMIWWALDSAQLPNWSYTDPRTALIVVALALEITALLASPGPRRGLQILKWRHYALVVLVAAALGAIDWRPSPPLAVERIVPVAVVAIAVAGMAAASARSRRIMALLTLPAYYFILGFAVLPSIAHTCCSGESGWFGPLRMTLTFLPVAAVLVLAVAAAVRIAAVRTIPAAGQHGPVS